MSLTSYRAAPPRDKPLPSLSKKPKRLDQRPRAPLPSRGFLRRQPLAAGGLEVAGGMYQCRCALERAAGLLFIDFVTGKISQIALLAAKRGQGTGPRRTFN